MACSAGLLLPGRESLGDSGGAPQTAGGGSRKEAPNAPPPHWDNEFPQATSLFSGLLTAGLNSSKIESEKGLREGTRSLLLFFGGDL